MKNTTLKQMYEKAQQFTDEVEVDILNGDFKFVRGGEHTYEIEIQNVNIEIWMTNEPATTRIYSIRHGLHRDRLFSGQNFTEPHLVRNALLAHSTDSMEDIAEEHC